MITQVCDHPINSCSPYKKDSATKADDSSVMNRSEEMYLIDYEAFIDKGLGGKGQSPSPTTILPPTLHC